MTIAYKFDKDGGFYAHDPEREIIHYAYPNSIYAKRAKRKPMAVAKEMVCEMARELDVIIQKKWYRDRYEHMLKKMEAADGNNL